MTKINFVNNTTPALNATNLNKLQTNVENEFTAVNTGIETANNNITAINNKLPRKQIFFGSGTAGTTLTINTTWANIGVFKNLVIEFVNSSINQRGSTTISYNSMATGSNLYDGKINSNVYSSPFYKSSNEITRLHLIPNTHIGTNTIKFDDFTSITLAEIYVEY